MGRSGFSEQFKAIQKDRQGVVQSSVYPGIKELVSEIYPEEAHFIYELLQNAEDAKATSVYFEIQKTQLIFKHNGTKQFDADDVDSITNIAKSTKKENYVQAGKFGIGFKSVYAFTDTPSIYCDSVCFRIDQLLLPVQIEDLPNRERGWTEFRFLFDSPKISAEEARKKIRLGLVEIENTTLLFLNNINHLNYKLEDGSSYSVRKETNGRFITCSMVKSNNVLKRKDTWIRFTKDSSLGGKSIQVDVAFPMTHKDKEKKYDFVRGEDKVCIKFLAKNEKSNLRFYINAPFGCTPARDTVNKGDRANKELVKEIASLMTTTIIELRDTGYLTDAFFDILPLEEDDVPEFYHPIVDAIKKSFSDRQNLPTMVEGQYVTTENGIMSRRDVIDKIFTQRDIRLLFRNDAICFVRNRPVSTRAYKFLKSLEIKELTPDAALIQMKNIGNRALIEWLKTKTNEEISDLYAFLAKGVDNLKHHAEKYEDYEDYVTKPWNRYRATAEQIKLGNYYLCLKEQISQIKTISIVKTSDGSFSSASGVYLVETEIEVPKEFKIVARDLYKNEQAKRFLHSMGVKPFTQEELAEFQYNNEIAAMKAYLSGLQKMEIRRALRPIEIVRKVLNFLKSHRMDEIVWNDYQMVFAKRSEKHSSNWHKISDCCLDKPLFEETGLNEATSVHKKCIIDSIYNELTNDEKSEWINFLKKNGVLWEIRVQRIDGYTSYVTGVNYDYDIDFLEQYLELRKVSLARYIWKSLSKKGGWDDSYETQYYKINRNYSGHTEISSVLLALKNTKWVPDRNGVFLFPRDVSRNTIDTSFVIDESNGFLTSIEFGANAKKQEEAEKARREREFLEKEQQREAAKKLGFDSPDEVLASKKDSELMAKLREAGFDPESFLENAEKKRKEKKKKDIDTILAERQDEKYKEDHASDYDPAAIVQNPERRRKKAEEELGEEAEEPRRKVSVRKDVKPNKEEKQFLYNQYSGSCQVCLKRIVKKDGSYYFEAINLMNTSELEEKYLTGLNLGWNSLCMCPNCAAEYQHGAVSLYDFKDKVLSLKIDKTIDDYILFPIRMQGEERSLRYSPVHLFNLQTALNHFNSVSDESTYVEDSSEENKAKAATGSFAATLIKKLDAGDRCPDCGTQNTHSTTITVIDNNGDSQRITGILCQCGAIYLTRKLYKKIANPEIYNIVSVGSTQISNESKYKKITPYSPVKTIEKTGSVSNDINQSATQSVERCFRCGSPGIVFESGLCWNCYKDERQSMYE